MNEREKKIRMYSICMCVAYVSLYRIAYTNTLLSILWDAFISRGKIFMRAFTHTHTHPQTNANNMKTSMHKVYVCMQRVRETSKIDEWFCGEVLQSQIRLSFNLFPIFLSYIQSTRNQIDEYRMCRGEVKRTHYHYRCIHQMNLMPLRTFNFIYAKATNTHFSTSLIVALNLFSIY